jgi:hypothetical protein
MKRTIVDDIGKIVGTSIETLTFLNISQNDIKNDEQLPLCCAYSIKSGLTVDKSQSRYDVTIMILEKMPDRKMGVSDLLYQQTVIDRQDELADVVETIIEILTGQQYNFGYDLESDVEYSFMSNFTDFDYLAASGEFTVSVKKNTPRCCITFDKNALRAL